MNEKDFLSRLSLELGRQDGIDRQRICAEYRKYFAVKRMDGYSDEEICSMLRSPAELANVREGKSRASRSVRGLITLGLVGADAGAALMFLIMLALGIAILMLSLYMFYACGSYLAGCTPAHVFRHFDPAFEYYWSGALMGLALGCIGALGVVGDIYYAAFLRQIIRALTRFNRNALNEMSGKPILPPLSINARLKGKLNRRLRNAALICLTAFALCFALGWLSASNAAGARFYDTWNWFD